MGSEFSSFILLAFLFTTTASQEITIKFTEELVIGNDENASAEYLFELPRHVCTDSNNNMYNFRMAKLNG